MSKKIDEVILKSLKRTFPQPDQQPEPQSKLRVWLRSERADMLLPLFLVVMGALILAVMELAK